jgi:intein/homing endonuclease
MDFSQLSDEKKAELAKLMLAPLNSAREIKDWAKFYLDLEIPTENTDPDSTSNPLDAAWYIYETFKHNWGATRPGAIMISCREGLKCQIKGTEILKKNGLEKIENIKVGDEIWTGFSWQKVKATFDEGEKPAIKIVVDGGLTCIGTPIHRYWTLRNGVEQWIHSAKLNPETDLICVNINTGLANNSKIENQENYDIGYFLGLLMGNGGVSFLDTHNSFFLTTEDDYIQKFYYSFLDKHFPEAKVYIKNKELCHIVSNKKYAAKLEKWGLKNAHSWEKTIPDFCYSDISAMKGFVAGLFDKDGSWDKKGNTFIEITAKELIIQLQRVLISFGIDCSVRHSKKLHGTQKHKTSSVTIGQTESIKFENLGIKG